MQILLTGGAGDLGSVLTRELLAQDLNPTRLDIRAPQVPRGRFVMGSILDRPTLEKNLAGIDLVVHIAAWHGVHEQFGWKTPAEFWDLNVTGTFNVFQAAVQAGVSKLIYISSTSVRQTEGMYGFTKRLGEEIAQDYARRHHLAVVLLRPRAFLPFWNKAVYPSYLHWAQWFSRGAMHIDDVAQGVLKSMALLVATDLLEPLVLTLDAQHDYTTEDLETWDRLGAATTFKKYYASYYDLALRYQLPITVKPRLYDLTPARHHLGYAPNYGLKNLLAELARYGEVGPPVLL